MTQTFESSRHVAPGLPLSSEQRNALASSASAVCLALDIQGELDPQRLEQALHTAVQQHTVLRHAFGMVSGYRGLRQQALTDAPPQSWRVFTALANVDRIAGDTLRLEYQQWQQQTFAPAAGEVLQARLIRCGDVHWQLWLAASALVADARSLLQLVADIRHHYMAGSGAAECDSFQYADYIEWRQSLDDDVDATAGRAYWANYAHRVAQAASPRLSYRQERGQTALQVHGTHLPATLSDALQDYAETNQTVVETVLHAAWLALLGKLTQAQQIRSVWRHDCRADYEPMAGAVGLYGKVFPVLLEVGAQDSFSDVLRQLAVLGEHHTGAQEYLTDDVAAAATSGIGFSVNTLVSFWRDATATWKVFPGPQWDARYELALHVDLADSSALRLQMHYAPQHYAHAAIDGLLRQFEAFLAQAIAHSTASLSALRWDDRALWSRRLVTQSIALDTGGDTLLAHIDRHAHATPQAIALCGSTSALPIDYASLMVRVNRLAHWLKEQGVGPQSRVGLALRRSPEMVVALLAVWRAGAAYLPIDPGWPAARRAGLLADAMPLLVLHDGADDIALAANEVRHVALATLDTLLPRYPSQAPAPDSTAAAGLSDAAYVLYTSGSTGTAKGVVIEHRQLLNYVLAASEGMQLASSRCWGLTSTVAADLGNTALFAALYHGATLAIADDDDMQDGAHFAGFIKRRRVDALKIVPSHLEALLEIDPVVLPSTIVLGGETAAPALVRKIWQHRPDCRVFNHYGPTETTVGVMWHAVTPDDVETDTAIPLTQVMANCRVAVFDDMLRETPVGAVGQLYIGGAQNCRGYLNRSVDSSAFVVDPLDASRTWYRSGDLACYLPQGGLRILGRADDQVKIRGFRIEPAEIEVALLQQSGIRQAVVLAHGAADQTASLTAFLVGESGRINAASLRPALLALLPEPMVPSRYVMLAAFPRLANGKIDRRALLQSLETAVTDASSDAPSNMQSDVALDDDLEFVVLDTMTQLLPPVTQALGRHSDFIEAGGHSLLAIKLVARLRKLFRIDIAPALVFDHATPAALAAALRQQAPDRAELEQLAALRRTLLEMPAAERDALLEQV
ncbi:non-ribosomal peptide synthetase [Herbaspirillum sp. meg3]|uniref:non-ribosomal peptide synthetase n=1 Tax=Herbaspirillum sp. meg3 TaxID=2025949 RepID=UPI000B9918AF|nr:amino acid adenylation domain-containing protein [Herbaspirillum sp. meg3]ASU38878.1 non-ribosomal peptide synthetase [Herbaspirillum sp. meg3]